MSQYPPPSEVPYTFNPSNWEPASNSSLSNYVTLTTPQNISGVKTFTAAPSIATITNTGSLTLPSTTTTLVGRNTTDVLQNKTIGDATDSSKQLAFDTSNNTTAIKGTFKTQFSSAKTITFPDATDTAVTLATTQALTNKDISSSTNTFPSVLNLTGASTFFSTSQPYLKCTGGSQTASNNITAGVNTWSQTASQGSGISIIGGDHFYVTNAGIYLVSVSIHWQQQTSTFRQLSLSESTNGEAYYTTVVSNANGFQYQQMSQVMKLPAADSVYANCLQISGGNLTLYGDYFQIIRLC